MLLKVISIFLGAIVLDILVARYTRCVAVGNAFAAAGLSGVITLANLAILGAVLESAETLGVFGAVAMAGGASVGTLLGLSRRLKMPSNAPPGISPGPTRAEPATPG